MGNYIRIAVIILAKVRDEDEALQAKVFYETNLGEAMEAVMESASSQVQVSTFASPPTSEEVTEDWSDQPAGQFKALNDRKKRLMAEAAADMAADMRGEIQG